MTWHFVKYYPLEALDKALGYDNHVPCDTCTCGAVKACEPNPPTGHSDWCDINNPPPETEELPF